MATAKAKKTSKKRPSTAKNAAQVPETRAHADEISALLAKVPETLEDEERAYFRGGLSAEIARRDGAAVESTAVLDELIRVTRADLAPLVTGKAPGYGPLRLRYALELGAELADLVTDHDEAVATAAGAGAARTTSLKSTRALRRRAIRALKNLAGRRSEERARIQKATAKTAERPDERARSLEDLALELGNLIKRVPARVAIDAGATAELIDDLRARAKNVLSTREKAQGARGSIASLYDRMNELDGYLLEELRLMLAALRDAKDAGVAVAVTRSPLVHRSGKKKGGGAGVLETQVEPASQAESGG